VATDPRKMRPGELCRLLNSTPLGEVTSERQIYRHRQRAGNRVGQGSTVDLLRYRHQNAELPTERMAEALA